MSVSINSMTFWKLCCSQQCLGSLMPRTGETSGFTYRRRAAGWSKMKIVTKHNPRSPRPRWSWSREKYRSSWAFWLLIYPMLEGGWTTRFRGGISYLQKRWDHHSPCKELIDPGTDDESCELQVFEVKLTQNYVAPLKSRSYKLKCTFPPRNNDGSVENDSSFFFLGAEKWLKNFVMRNPQKVTSKGFSMASLQN